MKPAECVWGRLCLLAGRDRNRLNYLCAGLNWMAEPEELWERNSIRDFELLKDYLERP